MLKEGIKGCIETVATSEKTAKSIGSGGLDVFATPMMISLMEETCFKSVDSELEAENTTVGIEVNIKHLAATPVGMKVRCESELIKIDNRSLTFNVKAYDEKGLIGEGVHQRFIVNREKFQKKANEKLM
jgi:thioesterase superfamily protein